MDGFALVLVSIPLIGVAASAVFYFLKLISQRLGYSRIGTPACSQIQIQYEEGGELQRQPQSVENISERLEGDGTAADRSRHRERATTKKTVRRKQTFVKLHRPLPVQPVCASKVKWRHREVLEASDVGERDDISKEVPQDQEIPPMAATQRKGKCEGEVFSCSSQDLCPVCQQPLPANSNSSLWTSIEHPPSSASSQQVICPDCWPLVRPHIILFVLFIFLSFDLLLLVIDEITYHYFWLSFQPVSPFRSWRWLTCDL